MTFATRPPADPAKSYAIVAGFTLAFLGLCLWLARAPSRQFFDEVWYAGQCANDTWDQVLVMRDHPPLGFAILCSGVRVFGDVPFGWRIPSVLMGAASIAALLSLLVQLRVRTSWLVVAGIFLVSDPILLVLSRMSMLDSSLLFFFALSVSFFLRSISDPANETRHLVAAGIAIGAASCVKWSGAILPMAFFAYYAFSQRDYQDMRIDLRCVLALVVTPVVVFVLLHLLLGYSPSQFLEFMAAKVRHHVAYSPITVVPITSRPWEWLLLQKPVPFLPPELARGDGAIVAAGHPIGHLGLALVSSMPVVWRAARTRPAVKLALLLVVLQLAAWAIAPRITFLYYLATITPFLVIAIADALSEVELTRTMRASTTTLVVLQLAYGAYLLPVIAGRKIPDAWEEAYVGNPFLAPALRGQAAPAAVRPSAAATTR